MTSQLSEQDWAIRLYVYETFVAISSPPSVEDVASRFNISSDEARRAYHRLHDAHAFFLKPSTDRILMANPLSAVPTHFRVYVENRLLYANCAWDTLGIPAILHKDARIEAEDGFTGEELSYQIVNGKLQADDLLVHFALPFAQWYDDLIHT